MFLRKKKKQNKSRFKIIYDRDLFRIIKDTQTGYQYLAYTSGVGTGLTRLLNKWGV
jgi:hypothetical protein